MDKTTQAWKEYRSKLDKFKDDEFKKKINVSVGWHQDKRNQECIILIHGH